MRAPTYDIRNQASRSERYLQAIGHLANWVTEVGKGLEAVVDAYGEYVEATAREARRSSTEYLLEALALGVLWRARGAEASNPNPRRQQLVTEIIRERRGGMGKRRDASTAALVEPRNSPRSVKHDPSPTEIQQLLNWLWATGEYDDECKRLEGWVLWLSLPPASASREILRFIAAFAMLFEQNAQRTLGCFTAGVEHFVSEELFARPAQEDTVQCSRRSLEYHLNMVGAEVLNRVWRMDFLACHRHVVVMPGCARAHQDAKCKAKMCTLELKCSHCTEGCAVSAGTRLAQHVGAKAMAVMHGSDFTQFLTSSELQGGNVGIIGVACAPGLLGAGWRAREKGLPAQCVLLNSSGCNHWLERAQPTSFDVTELARILARTNSAYQLVPASHVA